MIWKIFCPSFYCIFLRHFNFFLWQQDFLDNTYKVSTYFTRDPKLVKFMLLKIFLANPKFFWSPDYVLLLSQRSKYQNQKYCEQKLLILLVFSHFLVSDIICKTIYFSCYMKVMKVSFRSSWTINIFVKGLCHNAVTLKQMSFRKINKSTTD